jgi:hypothetical protein
MDRGEERKEGAVKKEDRKETKKAKYRKPILTKFQKLTDILAQRSDQ